MPHLVAEHGVSRDVAAKLLIAAGDNPDRIRTVFGFAALYGVSPVSASSGKTNRHRLNRSGDRHANNALWVIAMVRLRRDPATRAHSQRRKEEEISHREIVRCIKRYLARRLYPILFADLAALTWGYRCRLAQWTAQCGGGGSGTNRVASGSTKCTTSCTSGVVPSLRAKCT